MANDTDTPKTPEADIPQDVSPSGGATVDGDFELSTSSGKSGSMILTTVMGVFLFAAVFSIALFVKFPLYTYEAEKHTFSEIALAKSVINARMDDIEKKAIVKEYGIDFSPLLVPQRMESTDVMKTIAARCMPSSEVSLMALPQTAHETFNKATDYLACAIRNNVDRFCHGYHRQRLVEQLMAYLNIRQRMIAVEQSRLELLEKRYATHSPDTDWQHIYPRIDDDIDHRIGAGLADLTHKGYISPVDFGWRGVILPRKYAPFLADGVLEENRCG